MLPESSAGLYVADLEVIASRMLLVDIVAIKSQIRVDLAYCTTNFKIIDFVSHEFQIPPNRIPRSVQSSKPFSLELTSLRDGGQR